MHHKSKVIENIFIDKKKVKIAYLIAGLGGLENTLKATNSLARAGVDILELGIPYSDPIADGAIIQKGMYQALKQGINPLQIMQALPEIKAAFNNKAVVLFSYLNPILSLNLEFKKLAKKAELEGILLLDMPQLANNNNIMKQSEINFSNILYDEICRINLVTPNTNKNRMEEIASFAKGFLYYVCRKGITGIKKELPNDIEVKVDLLKKVFKIPIAVGFGLSSPKHIKQVFQYADGVIIGSYFINALLNEGNDGNKLYDYANYIFN